MHPHHILMRVFYGFIKEFFLNLIVLYSINVKLFISFSSQISHPMKNNYIILLFSLLCSPIFSQVTAVEDIVYCNMGDVLIIYPLGNDNTSTGEEIKITYVDVNPYAAIGIEVLNFNDTSITIKVPDYYYEYFDYDHISYRISNESGAFDFGEIFVFIDKDYMEHLDINNVSASFLPNNIHFYQWIDRKYTPLYEFPKEAETSTIRQHALWIGGKDEQGLLHFSGEYDPFKGPDFWPGPLSTDGEIYTDSILAANWARTWSVSSKQVSFHIANYNEPNYQIPEPILNWPAHGDESLNQSRDIAPFVDVDNDEEYHPENGDYPLIKGDLSVFFVYNDVCQHLNSDGDSLGIEVHCMAWAFANNEETERYDNTIFMNYKITNRSIHNYDSTYIGFFTDLSIGNSRDDYLKCDVENSFFSAYNGDDYDEPQVSYKSLDTMALGYLDHIPSQGICFLGGPLMDEDQMDNPQYLCDESINGLGFGDDIVDNERLGMTNFYQFFIHTFPFPPQYRADKRYRNMRGIFVSGYVLGEGETPWQFMYPDKSDTCFWGFGGINPFPEEPWTEESAGWEPGPRKVVSSMGPFTFEAGSVEYIDVALVTAPGDQEINSNDLLRDYIIGIREDYILEPMEFGNQYLGLEDGFQIESLLEVFPNPINGNMIHFEIPKSNKVSYKIYNTSGQMVQEAALEAQENQSIQVVNLNPGWYVLEVNADGKIFRSKLIK